MLRVMHEHPISIPEIQHFSTGGLMALTKASESIVYCRGVPENTIIRALFDGERLTRLTLILCNKLISVTDSGQSVIGYEDPTFIPKKHNPFARLGTEDGLLCTQVYPSVLQPTGKVDTNLVYVPLRSGKATKIEIVLTPDMLVATKVAKIAYQVKEGELFTDITGRSHLLFEYGGIHHEEKKASHIGICQIQNRRCVNLRRFWTATEDGSAHVSTCGTPIPLSDGRLLLFFNRRRDYERTPGVWDRIWGITYMILEYRNDQLHIVDVCPDFLLRPPVGTTLPKSGQSGEGQLINFGSCVSLMPDNNIEILSHVRDDQPYRAVIRFT